MGFHIFQSVRHRHFSLTQELPHSSFWVCCGFWVRDDKYTLNPKPPKSQSPKEELLGAFGYTPQPRKPELPSPRFKSSQKMNLCHAAGV